ncbi:MAG: TIGR00266 family protein [Candidatus Parvarchaeota archaeon]|nr:TIGR00266 family protein [Candidatus Parvarchaeota archaeon]
MVDYVINGEDIQYLNVGLKFGESVFIEPGHLIFKEPSVNLDISAGGLKGAFSHLLAGSAVFLLKVDGPGSFASAGFLPGKVIEIDLNGSGIIAEFNSFLCMDSSISYSSKFAGVFQAFLGGEGIFLEEFTGTSKLFLHGHGRVIQMDLKDGEYIQAEASHILAFDAGMQYSVKKIGNLKTTVLAGLEGEGLFFAEIHGPGKVWLHTISLVQLAAKLSVRSGGNRI